MTGVTGPDKGDPVICHLPLQTERRDMRTVRPVYMPQIRRPVIGLLSQFPGVSRRFAENCKPLTAIWPLVLRKEVIQPQVPLRLPCYDFTPVADPTVARCLLS